MTLLELQNILGDAIKAISVEDPETQAFMKAEYTSKVAKQMINTADVVLRADKLCGTHDRIDYLVGKLSTDGKA
jgi:hypothetical protein